MEELYRFLLHRSAEELDLQEQADDVSDLSNGSDFQDDLQAETKQVDRMALAKNFQNSALFVGSISDWIFGHGLLKVAYTYLEFKASAAIALSELQLDCAQFIAESDPNFRVDISTPALANAWLQRLVADPGWLQYSNNLKDSILAIRESNQKVRGLADLVAVNNAMHLIERITTTSEDKVKPGRILQATLYLPGIRDVEVKTELDEIPDEDYAALEAARLEFENLDTAIEELLNVPRTQLEVTEEEVSGLFDPRSITVGRGDEDDEAVSATVLRNIKLGTETISRLSEPVKRTLDSSGTQYADTNLIEVLDVLRAKQKTIRYYKEKSQGKVAKGVKFGRLKMAKGQIQVQRYPRWVDELVPETTGDVSPAGIGDLMVVKQHLKRYEGGDVAHIENILQGEVKVREHQRHHLTEDTYFDEIETEKSESHETQTTSRFELKTEVKKTAKAESSMETGIKFSASYGPAVKLESNVKFAQKNAKTASRNRATVMSKELVEKAATKYSEKMKSSVTRRILDEVNELNRHTLDATAASGHVVGVYQWVNKVYESQVFNYGQRVMYEFMVPEPASFYIWSLGQAADQGESLAIPPAFDLSANDIKEWNYADLAALYDATDVPTPPEPFITREVDKSGGPNPEKGSILGSASIDIPDGYEYWSHNLRQTYSSKKDGDTTKGFNVSVSQAYHTTGPLPILYRGYSITGFAFFVHVLCRRTHNAMEEWRMKVWETLHTGHQIQVSNYQEKLAALLAQSGVQIQGRNPYYNRKLERAELQKSCISLLTGTHPSWVQGMKETQVGPVIKNAVAKTHGAYVRFMEQAYEWENMNYVFYPYFWARVKKWLELMNIEDVDPEFQEFLTSGYARVVVPVRPGFESAVEHFRQTGQIWSGGKLPDITDPDYLPIAEEIKARQQAEGDEIAIGEPWEVLLPTQLVKLRADNTLPEWEKQADGSWTEKQAAS
ncbi:MAG TPA: hypothetical protein ENJ82_02870 [Bacteroidetes bacterium]|nr:hypothetical protein [Bacteroidota bacterium]